GRMEQAGDALEEVLSKALSQRSLTLGVYEAAKLLNVRGEYAERGFGLVGVGFSFLVAFDDSRSSVFCCAFSFWEGGLFLLLCQNAPPSLSFQNPHASQWKDPALSQLMCFCRESRYMDQWVPVINLPER
ncbi:GA45A protein, partial [Sagittarius serpentarius]|nr:GA45A protein [Sagittarius serpentarius]